MKKALLALGFLAVLGACSYSRSKEPGAGDSGHEKVTGAASVDFAVVQKALIRPRCLGCHSSTRTEGGLNLETYASTRASLNRIAYRVLEKKDMPPSGQLSEREIKVLDLWLEQGAPERSLPGANGADSGKLSRGAADWEKIRENLFRPKCFDCHSGAKPEADLDLSSYDSVQLKAARIFDRVVIKQDMPKPPYPSVTPRERQALLKWFDSGLPR